MERYDHRAIESKWQTKWLKEKIYQPDLARADRPYYNLMMFPYPSAEGLHVGNMYAFTGADIHGRFQRMQGQQVFEPIGLDGFGIHSENYALKVRRHPASQAKISEERFYDQMHKIGSSFAWDNHLETYDPEYYKWTQWIFIQLFKKGLAYRGKAKVNWCPKDKTVLADEQVIAGCCERCGTAVEIRELEQWFFKITAYADRLLKGLDTIDWSAKVKIAQRNWIGKKQGAEIKFRVVTAGDKNIIGEDIWVFTTRPDTLFGTTFIVLSPDHPLLAKLVVDEQSAILKDYLAEAKKAGPADLKDKSGVFTGAFAVNPVNGQDVPIWVAKYVVSEYGTGAIMGVPAHDERDYDFAKEHGLDMVEVILPYGEGRYEPPYTGEGKLVRSGSFNDLISSVAKNRLIDELAAKDAARVKTSFRLRDWLISRQRYWGPPIPMISCPTHGWVPVRDEDLPVKLPAARQWRPSAGKTPLGRVPSFLKAKCPVCGEKATRSDEVSDTFLDSAWYFLRYPSTRTARSGQAPWDKDITKKWLPVNIYIGGAEHSVLHLLYARFLTMVFHDLGLLDFDEPFTKFRAHGLLVKEGAKMSKSKGNVVVPDEYIKVFGADTLRMYLMFLGPFDQGGNFQDKGIAGLSRFLKRVWQITHETAAGKVKETDPLLNRHLQATIRKISKDIPELKFNTAIAAMMEFLNSWDANVDKATLDVPRSFLRLLAPFAPHITEELWTAVLKEKFSIHTAKWPEFDAKVLQERVMTVVVTIDGKVRDQLEVPAEASEDEVVAAALSREKVKKWVGRPRRTIYVPGRVLNIVT